jgi:uncharacterized membrane protein
MKGTDMKFAVFILGGLVLIVSGILQALVRPRRANESRAERLVNAATVRALFFVIMGILAILVGAGVIPLLPLAG